MTIGDDPDHATDPFDNDDDGGGRDAPRKDKNDQGGGSGAEPDDRAINLLVFERVLRARRVKLTHGWCAYRWHDREWRCFRGHGHFDDDEVWAANYAGPDFCRSLELCRGAEATVAAAGRMIPYLQCLLARVYPRWQDALGEEQVWEFWFAIAHASARDRAIAMAAAYSDDEGPNG